MPTQRNYFRFSLRAVFAGLTLTGLGFYFVTDAIREAQRQQQFNAVVNEFGGNLPWVAVYYDGEPWDNSPGSACNPDDLGLIGHYRRRVTGLTLYNYDDHEVDLVLQSLPTIRSLRNLELLDSGITDKGIKELRRFPLVELRSSIGCVGSTKADLLGLADIQTLRRVTISDGDPELHPAIAELRRLRPGLRITILDQ